MNLNVIIDNFLLLQFILFYYYHLIHFNNQILFEFIEYSSL